MRLINNMFQKLKASGLEYVTLNFDRFIVVLKVKGQNAEVTWKEVFLSFDWQFEKDKISEYINSMESSFAPQFEEIVQSFYDHEGYIDLEMVKKYIENSNSPKKGNNPKKFFKAIRDNRDRIQQGQRDTLMSYTNEFKSTDSEYKLHDGFNKMCGLRGS